MTVQHIDSIVSCTAINPHPDPRSSRRQVLPPFLGEGAFIAKQGSSGLVPVIQDRKVGPQNFPLPLVRRGAAVPHIEVYGRLHRCPHPGPPHKGEGVMRRGCAFAYARLPLPSRSAGRSAIAPVERLPVQTVRVRGWPPHLAHPPMTQCRLRRPLIRPLPRPPSPARGRRHGTTSIPPNCHHPA